MGTLMQNAERNAVVSAVPPRLRPRASRMQFWAPTINRFRAASKRLGVNCKSPVCAGDEDIAHVGFPDRKVAIVLVSDRHSSKLSPAAWSSRNWTVHTINPSAIDALAPEALVAELAEILGIKRGGRA